jgi:Na+/H+ antiporter NhaD/arsenite permease-like protein
VQALALAIFIAVFALAATRHVHVGVSMFAAACGVGVWLAGLPLKTVIGGFPVSLMVLLAGVTYFFGIAQANGTIDRVITAVLRMVGGRTGLLPGVFFLLTAGISGMGSPLAGLVMAPIGLPLARRRGVDPMLMGLAIGTGFSAGGFAPTSLFGMVSYGTARQASIALDPLVLFGVAVVTNLAILVTATVTYGRGSLRPVTSDAATRSPDEPVTRDEPWHTNQIVTACAMLGLVATVVGCAVAGIEPDIGVIAFAFGAALALVDPAAGRAAVGRIDWSTVLLVGGIVTYVGVLQAMGAVDMLGSAAKSVSVPLVSAVVICAVAGLVSAFASTTGILAALVPLALPLVAAGGLAGWALISALSVCASIVDVSPYSTVGATVVASASPEERPRMTTLLMWWSMALVVLGPIVLVAVLVLPASR